VAQQKELETQDPKRAEPKAVENFIQQAETETDEIVVAHRKASARVGSLSKIKWMTLTRGTVAYSRLVEKK
jgi:hypothetical protein